MVKKRALIWTVVAVAIVIGALVIVFVPGRERVSLTLLHYRSWPDGATLKLSNNTRKTITYFTQQGGSATLFVKKTVDGWIRVPLPVIREFARIRELKPGQSAEIYVGLEPDGWPMRVGIVCWVAQGSAAKRWGNLVGRVKEWCHMTSTPPGQIEVWCSEPLQVSAKPSRAEEK